MKLRLLDDSFRFRVTSDELGLLQQTGSLLTTSRFPGDDGEVAFTFGIRIEEGILESRMEAGPGSLQLCLSVQDLQLLLDPDCEGVYLKRQWGDPAGATRRAIAFVEKERRSSPLSGPEDWIYEKDADATLKTDS